MSKLPSDRGAVLSSLPARAALTLALMTGASAQAPDGDHQTDFAPLIARGFGVTDEPSIREQCGSGFEGIRIFEHAAGRPLALIRIEMTGDTTQVTARTYEGSRVNSVARATLSEKDRLELVDLIDDSGFWTYEMDDDLWLPDSPTIWIEVCLAGRFRSVSVYPEQTTLAVGVLDFLSARMP